MIPSKKFKDINRSGDMINLPRPVGNLDILREYDWCRGLFPEIDVILIKYE